VIEKNEMGWHVAHMGERRGAYMFLWGNLREGDHLESTQALMGG